MKSRGSKLKEDSVFDGLRKVKLARCLPVLTCRVVLVSFAPSHFMKQPRRRIAEMKRNRMLRLCQRALSGCLVCLIHCCGLGGKSQVYSTLQVEQNDMDQIIESPQDQIGLAQFQP